MRTTAYQAFIFQHRINLEFYLKQNYQLDFEVVGTKKICIQDTDLQLGIGVDYENTWIRSIPSTSEINGHGIKPAHGNILTWEALENNCSLTEAVTHVKLKSQHLPRYKSKYLQRFYAYLAPQSAYKKSLQHVQAFSNYPGLNLKPFF